jgi:hypothetical protein
MAKIVVIADPEMLPPELSDNPDVVIIPPASVDEACMAALDEASGGLLGSGEGALEDWAKEEEAEPEHSGSGEDEDADKDGKGDEDMPAGSGYGEDAQRIDDAADVSARGEDEDEDKSGKENPFVRDARQDAGSGRGRRSGRGEDDETEKRGGEGRSGRGRSPLAAWVQSQTGRR